MITNRRSILALVASVFLTPAQAQAVVGNVVPLTGLQVPAGSQLSIGAKGYLGAAAADDEPGARWRADS